MLKCVLKNHKQEQKKKIIKSNEQRVLNIIIRPLILDGWHQCSLAKSLHQGVRQNTKNLTNKQTKKETLVQKVRKNMQSQLRAQGERIVVPHADIGRIGQRKRTNVQTTRLTANNERVQTNRQMQREAAGSSSTGSRCQTEKLYDCFSFCIHSAQTWWIWKTPKAHFQQSNISAWS